MKSIICISLIFILSAFGQNDTASIRIGLALSGGGALGFAHLGVLKVLEQEGIKVSYISGNSMGSLVGGLYSAGYSTAQIESIATNVDWWTIFSSDIPFGARYLPERQQNQNYAFQLRHQNFIPSFPSGLVPIQNVEFLLMKLLAEIEYNTFYEFDSLPIPYRAIAVDLEKREKVVFNNHRLSNAIRSSIAIPGVFAPEQVNGESYVDGGVIQNLPVDPLLEFKPDLIIASLTLKHNPETGISLIDVISRSLDLVAIEDLKQQKQLADVLIEPNVDPFTHSDFFHAQELIKAGEIAARNALPQIREKINGRTIVQHLKKTEPRPPSIIRSTNFQGMKVTHKSLLKSKMTIRNGTVLKFNKLISDLSRIYHTGFFEHVDYRLEFPAEDSVDVTIELQEKPFGFYYLGVLYNNFDNVNLGLEVGQGNLSGSGASARGAIHIGNPNEFRLGLSGTRLFNFPFGYRLDGFWSSIEHALYLNGEWQTDYTTDNRGGIAEAGYILGRDAFFDLGFNVFQSLYKKPSVVFFDSFPDRQWIIGPSFRIEFNNFNNYFFPTSGITYQISGLYSTRKLKASENFLKLNYFSEQVIKLADWMLVHPGLEIGMSWEDVALSEYYHNNGFNFVGLDKDVMITDQKAIASLGTSFKIFELFKREDYPFYIQILSNIGTFRKLNSIYKDFNFTNDFHWGVGIGIKTNTPIGPFQTMLGIADFAKSSSITQINFAITVGREFRYTKE